MYVEHEVVTSEPFFPSGDTRLSSEAQSHPSSLSIEERYPSLKTFTLGYATAEELATLAVSPHSKLSPTLRHLTLHSFALDADDARVLEDFCSSRGLSPFNTHNPPFRLDRITVYMDDPDDVTLFRRYCLRVDDKSYDTLLNFKLLVYDADTVRLSLTIPILRTITHVLSVICIRPKKKLEDINRTISTDMPYFLILLEVCHFLPFSLIE